MSENIEHKRYLTTSQAAKLLSVSPDTVLKWVKAGKIKSHRTLGGHFRIPLEALGLNTQTESSFTEILSPVKDIQVHQYCWEYLSGSDEVKNECLECITYRSRAKRCYELRDVSDGFGCSRLLCQDDCNHCDYYKLVNGQGINVLVLSKSQGLIRNREDIVGDKDLHLEFVDTEYRASMLIHNFRPDYIILDCSLGKKQASSICSHLFDDPRIPVARIILTSKTQKLSDYCEKEVFGWIRKPFTLPQLKDCIRGVSIKQAG